VGGGHVVLALVPLHQVAVRRQVVAIAGRGQRLGDAVQELLHAPVVDGLDAGQLHLLDRLAGRALDRAQHALLARRHEPDGAAAAMPRAISLPASSSVPALVRANTIIASYGSASRIRVSASSLCRPLTNQ